MIIKLENTETKETVKGELTEVIHYLTENFHSPDDEFKIFFGDDEEFICKIDIHNLINALTLTFLDLKKEQRTGN